MAIHTFQVDLRVDGFGLTVDGKALRLDFPHTQMDGFQGSSGSFTYDAREIVLDGLQARLDRMQWNAEAGSVGELRLRTGDGNVELTMHRLEFPRGLAITRAPYGVELLAPHVSIGDATFTIADVSALRGAAAAPPPGASGAFAAVGNGEAGDLSASSDRRRATTVAEIEPEAGSNAPPPLRQRYLRFLDVLAGQLELDLVVDIDLPVIGNRKATHHLRVPIQDGSVDFKELTNQLRWLEGKILEFEVENDRLILGWGLPLMPTRELVSWRLDKDASNLAVFDRVPLRSLVDLVSQRKSDSRRRSKPLVSLDHLALRKIALAIAMTAPATIDFDDDALIQIGDESAPGLLDMKLAGDVVFHSGATQPAATAIRGAVGLLDATIKDLHMGGAVLSTDRIHLGGLENLDLEFRGLRPGRLTGGIGRIAATNLRLVIG
jgi:hypothetical protein